MRRYISFVVAASWLALCGCGVYGYPYGYGFSGYPYYDYPYGQQYEAPYYPSYGSGYDPYAYSYGYPYGYGSGSVVQAPPPPVVVETQPPEVFVEDNYAYQYPIAGSGEARRRWQAREQYRNRINSASGSTPTVAPGEGFVTPDGSRRPSRDWRREGWGNRPAQTEAAVVPSGGFERSQRSGAGWRTPFQGAPEQGLNSGRRGPTAGQFMNPGASSRHQMRTSPFMRSSAGAAPASPQVLQGATSRQSGAMAAPPMSRSPAPAQAPRPNVSGTRRSMPPPAQVSQPQTQAPRQTRWSREGRLRAQ